MSIDANTILADLRRENADLRAQLDGFNESLVAFTEAATGMTEELGSLLAEFERHPDRVRIAQAVQRTSARLEALFTTIGRRFPSFTAH